MKKIIIDRSKWRTGGNKNGNGNQTGNGSTMLLNKDGFMCCLGFECIRLGRSLDDVIYKFSPSSINWGKDNHLVQRKTPEGEVCEIYSYIATTEFTNIAMGINDDPDMTSDVREQKIKEHFATANIEVEFINEYTKPTDNDTSIFNHLVPYNPPIVE